ncbi:PAS domain S-box protein [Pontibacter anaerobius]|uniref:histidine kinase n=1 Tax=Pontibacter anaerobius TaxID=2993940 RepID=A0ABT3RI33_9BACT|nr:PAS domain S-box protein [Pontibacter anaerobius]MCX2741136.1 PAS domain S-box protein [Pontibacter anaerobius]
MTEKKINQGYERIIRYIGISFLSMLAAILLVCVFFYVQAREVQDKYNTSVQRNFKQLELVNQLFENKELSRNLLRAHVLASTTAAQDSVRKELARAFKANEVIIGELHQLLRRPEQLHRLHSLSDDLKTYHTHIDSVLQLSYGQQQEAAMAYTTAYLAPFYLRHQANLISLNNELTNSARRNTNGIFPAFTNLVDEYLFLLLLVVPFILWAAFAFNRITKRLQRENQRLNKEVREREQLQATLEEAQLHFKRLFDGNPIPMWVYDQHSLKFLEINEAAIQEYGFSREEFLLMTVLDIRPQPEMKKTKEHLRQLNKASDATTDGALHQRKDGTVFRVKLRSHAIQEKDGVYPRLVTSENIQEREEFIEQLAKREKQLREISSSIPGAVYQFQVDSRKNMAFPFLSDGINSLFGVTPEDVYNNPNVLFEAVHPHDIGDAGKSIEESTRNILPWVQDLRIWNKKQRKWTWVRGHGLPSLQKDGTLLYNGTFIDITDQKEAQAKLVTSEANLRALLDSSSQSIYLLDKEMNILLFNAVAASEVRELALNELQAGQSILHYTAEDQKVILRESHARALQGKPTVYETGNSGLWFEVAFRPVFTYEKEIIAVALSIHDISEQRNTVVAIKDSQMKLTRAQNLAKIGNWEYDLQKDTLTLSEYIYTIYGLSPATFTATFNNLSAFFHPDDKERVLEDYKKVVETKRKVVTEHRVVLESGKQKYLHQIMEPVVNYEGQVLRIIGTTQDITQQKEKEQEISETKDRFLSTIENIPEIILSADTQLRIFYISPQCREITGYTEQEFMQDHLWPAIIYPDDLPLLQEKLKQQVLTGQKVLHETRILARDGKVKWVLLRLSPMLNANGDVIRVDGSVADITERKMVEAKRTVLTEQLQVQNQNLQQFAYIVSHNLRAPIANILGLTSIYDRDRPQAALNKHVIENLARSAQHLDNTIRDLNDILTVRGQILNISEEIFFQDLLKDILKSISMEVENAKATIDWDFSEVPSTVSLRSYVHSILQNLVTNALKYRSPERKPHISIRSYKQKDYICIKISDNGLGIDLSKEKGNLFGLYKRFHHHVEGRGLGLHLVKTQVDLLEGKIEVDSQVGEGTTFKVYI